ncbi:MAG: response regulator, partial [Magnetococcales bacterium]|nr:response regulator [Magnetococcales bacterium]
TLLAGGEWRGELINQRKDGALFWESAAIAPVRDAGGITRHYVAVKEDITQRKQLEASLRQEENLMRSLLASMGEGVYGVNREGLCTFINPTALKMLGYSEASNFIGHNPHELIHYQRADGSPYPSAQCQICGVYLQGQTVSRDDERFFRADGASFPVEYRAHPLIDGDQVVGAVVTFSDITQRRHAELSLLHAKQAAEAASRAKSEFLAIMSHEVRTPLNAILGMAEVLAESELNEEQRLGVRVLRRAGNGLLSLITDILDLVAVESGRCTLEFRHIVLTELARETLAIHAFAAERKGVRLESYIDATLPERIGGDPKRLRQVLFNLVGNAVKFTGHGMVRLEINRLDSETIRFSVHDTGIGINKEQQASIFDPFFKIDASNTRQYGGTGLGLAICRKLVEIMEGHIHVESQEGKGSHFHLDLPLRRVEKPTHDALVFNSLPEVPTPKGPRGKCAILVADDAEDNRVLIRAFLKKLPCRLAMAHDGAEAVKLFTSRTFDLVLMDIQMPIMDGLQATTAIRSWEKESGHGRTPILALTAHAMPADKEKSHAAGCDEHLIKPITKSDLLSALARHAISFEEPT